MRNLNKKQYILDATGLISIGLFSLGYILFKNLFAELHIQFSFLNFPVFVGEILLFINLLLFLAKYKNNPQRLTTLHYVIICYFVFVIIKALYGYLQWGPLALRHAALLYYPVFIIFGCTFYRREFFGWKTCGLLLFLVISIFFVDRGFNSGYWTLTLAVLGVILIKSHPHKIIKSAMFLVLLVAIPYKEFFHTSRMMIVSNLLSGLYLIGMFLFIPKGKKKFKFVIGVMMGGIVLLGLFKSANHQALKSIVNFKRMAEVFSSGDKRIEANTDYYNAEERREVKLYNPNQVKAQPKGAVFEEAKKEIETAFVSVRLAEEKQGFLEEQATAEIRKFLIGQVKEGIETVSVGQIKEGIETVSVGQVKEGIETVSVGQVKEGIETVSVGQVKEQAHYNDNAVFRLFIWRDMLVDLANKRPMFGFDFGKPFRSKSLEILHWGDGDWARDGWVAAHNSYLHIIYRVGIVGIVLILSFLIVLFCMIKRFIALKSLTGILLCGIIINWFVAANFLLTFELPYTAIPIWTLFGLTYAYFNESKTINI